MALFSLDKAQAIPVDTHVWALACRYYTPHLKHKTLNKQVHFKLLRGFNSFENLGFGVAEQINNLTNKILSWCFPFDSGIPPTIAGVDKQSSVSGLRLQLC